MNKLVFSLFFKDSNSHSVALLYSFFSLLSVFSLGAGHWLVAGHPTLGARYDRSHSSKIGMGEDFFLLCHGMGDGTGMFMWEWDETGVKIHPPVTL